MNMIIQKIVQTANTSSKYMQNILMVEVNVGVSKSVGFLEYCKLKSPKGNIVGVIMKRSETTF